MFSLVYNNFAMARGSILLSTGSLPDGIFTHINEGGKDPVDDWLNIPKYSQFFGTLNVCILHSKSSSHIELQNLAIDMSVANVCGTESATLSKAF